MGSLVGSGCDSLPVDIVQEYQIQKIINIFYHPTWHTIFLNAQGLQGKKYTLSIFDISGKQLFSEQGKLSSKYFTKNLQCNYANGIYFVSLTTEKEMLNQRFIIE